MGYDSSVEAMLERWRTAAAGIGAALDGAMEWAPARAVYDQALVDMFDVLPGTVVGTRSTAGVPGRVVSAGDGQADRVILYLHGGGYASGAARAYDGLAARFARRLGARVHLVDYRLAPEHPFPAAIDDALTAYREIVGEMDPRRLILAGDSAGGAMVITVLRRARDAGLPLPAAGLCISPWADLSHRGRSMLDRAGIDPLVRRKFLDALASALLGDRPWTDPDVSPVYADVRGLPPIMVQIGEREIMLSDAIRLAEHLAESRVRVSLEVWPGMFHVWPLFAGFLDDADRAIESAMAYAEAAIENAERK